MIKLRDLQYLVAIDDHKHFGHAAAACCVSQPTISGQIIKLESQLGLQLIERHKRKVLLTAAGQALIDEARNVIQTTKRFEDKAKSLLDPMAGDLHVGLIPTLAPYLLPHIMKPLTRELRDVKFFLYEEKTQPLLTKLNQGDLDFVVLPYLDSMSNFEQYQLFEEELVLALSESHPLVKKADNLHLNDIRSESILTLEDGHCLRDQALGYCFSAGANEDWRFKATSLESLRHMVGAGMGITLLPKLATLGRGSENNIRYIPFAHSAPKRQISLLVRPNYCRTELIRNIVGLIRNAITTIDFDKPL